jgi:hypothetical protein
LYFPKVPHVASSLPFVFAPNISFIQGEKSIYLHLHLKKQKKRERKTQNSKDFPS